MITSTSVICRILLYVTIPVCIYYVILGNVKWIRYFCTALLCLLCVAFINANRVIQTTYEIKSSSLNQSYKILMISDTHFGGGQLKSMQLKALKDINTVKPDIVILAGDIVEELTTEEEAEELFSTIGRTGTRYGIYFVYGNHDYALNQDIHRFSRERLVEIIESNDIKILQDESVVLNDEIMLIGRDDRCNQYRKSLDELLDSNSDHYTIVVDHVPSDSGQWSYPVDLFLSGHTHAGQVWLLQEYLKYFGDGLLYGYYDLQDYDTIQIISSGAAVGAIPYRTAKHCEYVIIDLIAEE